MASELVETQNVGKKFDPENTGRLTETIVNGFISYTFKVRKALNYRDNKLWMVYQEDFVGWSKFTFNTAHSTAIRILGDFLRENGVFANKGKSVSMINSSLNALNEDDQHIWTPTNIQFQLVHGQFNSRLVDRHNTSQQVMESQCDNIRDDLVTPSKFSNPQVKLLPQSRSFRPYSKNIRTSTTTTFSQPSVNQEKPSLFGGRGIISLRKAYNQEMKYNGVDDSLFLKLEIFYDI